MIAGHVASPTISPRCSLRPAIRGDISTRRIIDPCHRTALALLVFSLRAVTAHGVDSPLVPVHSDAAQALTPQHPGGCFLDRFRLGWLQLLANDAPPTRSALAEVLPDDLVAERSGSSASSLARPGVPLHCVFHSLAPDGRLVP